MAVTYTKITYPEPQPQKEEKTVEAYDDWRMYTPQGNAEMKRIAQAALNDAEALLADKRLRVWRFRRKAEDLLIEYLISWYDVQTLPAGRGGGDTAVREMVYMFFDELARGLGYKEPECDDLWYTLKEEALLRFEERT